tara:strand:+ start:2906 stop:3637 length:732 start_codon:yes stop_codon:yes gene_type:complete
MPRVTREQQIETYTALKLFEAVLNLCFASINRHIPVTEADNLYVFLGLRDALEQCLGIEHIPETPPDNLLPTSIAGLTDEQHMRLSGYFGVIKDYAKKVEAHSARNMLPTEISELLAKAQTVIDGGTISTKVLLEQSDIEPYDYETKTLVINATPVRFEGVQEDYFLWCMFRYRVGVDISWDQIDDEVDDEFGDKAFKQGKQSIYQAMRRVNDEIKAKINTEDDFFTYKSNGFRRNYGPEPED